MMVLKRSEMTYYIRDHVVTIEYRQQFVAFTAYTLKNKKRFNEFVGALEASRSPKYSTLDSMFGLARRYGLVAVGGFDPKRDSRLKAEIC